MANAMYGFGHQKDVSKDRKLTSGMLITYRFLFSKLLEDAENANLTSLFAEIKSYLEILNIEMTRLEVQNYYDFFMTRYYDASKSDK